MFESYKADIHAILARRFSGVEYTPGILIDAVLELLTEMVEANTLATPTEFVELAIVNGANEEQARSLVSHALEALGYIADIKLMVSTDPALSQGTRDHLWRGADAVQTAIECLLSRVDQRELDAWLDTAS